MTSEELEKTYPENTVFLFKVDNKILRANTSEYYVERGKDYNACLEALKKHTNYSVVQDETLYQVVLLLEDAINKAVDIESKKAVDTESLCDSLREIVYDINNIIKDIE